MLTRYRVYRQSDGLLLTTRENAEILERQGLILPSDKLLYDFDAHTPEEASAIYNLREGLEPYRPIGDPAKCLKCGAIYYPESSGVCWRCGKIE